MPEGAAHDPSGFVASLGRGWLGRSRSVVVLERRAGDGWREAGRFGSVRDADRALDEAVANGEAADSLRVAETYAASNTLLLTAGAVAVGAAIAIALYVIFG
jgi:hypothetical protein